MLIKKRWAWLMSVVLLGFLASADGHEKDCSLSVVEASVMDSGKKDIFQQPLVDPIEDEYVIVEDLSKTPIAIEAKYGELEKDIKALSLMTKSVEQQAFPYAIDSSPSMSHVASMLSYCVYHASLSMDECNEFWRQSCDGDAFHQFQLEGMNVMTVCKNDDRVYVAFAGTQSLSDGIVDVSALSQAMSFSKKSVFGHGGFIGRAKKYSSWLKEKLSSIEGMQQRELVLTGHSLGAALATLLAHDMYEGLGLNARGGVSNSLNQVKVIGFGSPSALLDPNSYFLGHLNHIRFYNPQDPVATTLSWMSGYGHVGVELVIPDRPSRHIARAGPLLSKQRSLQLIRQLPISYWNSLPPLVRSRFDLGIDAHLMHSYAILADATFSDHQRQRRNKKSVTALTNAEKAITKRIGALTVCRLENGKVICSSGGKIVAKFRYAMDALPDDHRADACMSDIITNNFVPGVTVNAGVSVGSNMSPDTAASEALILDISASDKWYEQMPSRTFAALYLDGHSPLPPMCSRKPTFLEPAMTLPTERTLIRKFIHAPTLFTLTKSHVIPETETVELVQLDPDFFGNANQGEWMDCRLPENSTFCPALCKDSNQACAVMKFWSTDGNGINHWVSLTRNPGVKWSSGSNDSWKYTITEKRTSWFSMLRAQNQATFMVVRDDPEGYLQFSN